MATEQRIQFAQRAGTSNNYLRLHLFPPSGIPDRVPRITTIDAMVAASNGKVSRRAMFDYFYG